MKDPVFFSERSLSKKLYYVKVYRCEKDFWDKEKRYETDDFVFLDYVECQYLYFP
jgi:hypothetical protein